MVVNKRYIIFTIIAVIISMLLEIYICLRTVGFFSSFNPLKLVPGLVVCFLVPASMCCKIIMLINLYMMNRFVKWGMEIPVKDLDGAFRSRLDKMAAYLPFD